MLSIIVPVYNVQNYLKNCLDSIIQQTYSQLEIILVNDGSTDDSGNICEKYAMLDERIKVIHQQNKGRSSTRNTGLKYVTSSYITFVDADDSIDKDTYKTVMKVIENKNIDLVSFGIKVVGNYLMENRLNDDNYYKVLFKGIKKVNKETILQTDISVCNKVFKKDLIDKYNITFPEKLLYEDAAFFYKYISISKNVFYIPEKYYFYLRHESSIMVKTFQTTSKAIDHLYIFENIYCFYKNNNLVEQYNSLINTIFENYFYLSYIHSTEEKKKEVCNLGKKFIVQLNLNQDYDKLIQQFIIKQHYSKNKFINNNFTKYLYKTFIGKIIWIILKKIHILLTKSIKKGN